MRRSARLLALLFPLLALAPAPAASGQGFTGAIKLGFTNSAFDGQTNTGEDFDAITRLSGGAAVGYDFGNGLLFQPEILYVIKGGVGNSLQDDVLIRGNFDLTYVEVPLLLVYRHETRGRFHPKVFAGPSLGINQDAKIFYRAIAGGPTFDNDIEIASNKDWGLALGVGLEMDIGSQRLTFDVRTTRGFTNLRNNDRELQNAALMFMAGVQF